MRAHPARDRFQFISRRVALQVVTAPADQGDVTRDIAERRDATVDARRSVSEFSIPVPVVDLFTAAGTQRRSLDQVHEVPERDFVAIKRDTQARRPLQHALTHDAGSDLQRREFQPPTVLFTLRSGMTLGVQLAATIGVPLPIAFLPRTVIGGSAPSTECVDAAGALLVRRKVFARARVRGLTATAGLFDRHVKQLYLTDVWGNESANTATMEAVS